MKNCAAKRTSSGFGRKIGIVFRGTIRFLDSLN
jgi:hypothetical protein